MHLDAYLMVIYYLRRASDGWIGSKVITLLFMCIGPVKSYKTHVFAMTRVPEGSSLEGAKNSFAFFSFCLLRLKNTQTALASVDAAGVARESRQRYN